MKIFVTKYGHFYTQENVKTPNQKNNDKNVTLI